MTEYLTWFIPYVALLAACCALVESHGNRRSLRRFKRCPRNCEAHPWPREVYESVRAPSSGGRQVRQVQGGRP